MNPGPAVGAPERHRRGTRAPTPGSATANRAVAVAALLTRLERLAATAWDGLAAVAATDHGAARMAVPDASGWSPVAHLVAAERELVRAGRQLADDTVPAPPPPGGDRPPDARAVSPLLQLTWVVRAGRQLGRDLAGAPASLPAPRLQAVALRLASAEVHVTAALRGAGAGSADDGT